MKALIFNNRVCEIVEDDKTFIVYKDLIWVDCPREATTEWIYNGKEVESPKKEINISYEIHRRFNYPLIQEQLDMLWHGMNTDETKRIEPFYTSIKKIKEKYPKIVE